MIKTKDEWERIKVVADSQSGPSLQHAVDTIEALRDVTMAGRRADKILMPYWMGPEFGEKPTDKQIYEAIAGLNQALHDIPDWLKDG